MRNNLEKVTEWVLVHEGGYVNHPEDPGGATNMGVTQRVYDGWRRRKGMPIQSVKKITKDEVVAIYKDQYWDKVWGDHLPSGLDYSVYDFAINSGPSRAIKFLQRILGVTQDGIMGNVTFSAIMERGDIENIISALNYDRWQWLKRLRHWKTFGKGWTRRVMGSKEGFQTEDYGVIDRSIMLWRQKGDIPPPKPLHDGANVKTVDEKLSIVEETKEGLNLDNAAKFGAGSIPAWMTAFSTVPEGPMQWAVSAGMVMVFGIVALWLFKKLR
ncbi:MAG: putative glycosyl hydrolase [Prokaryotic dsDNA virus sp.]|mgnify:CR=1 FL=1|jgi:lysozyme family protein|nr:N-acetylmuramidase [Flavobacteriaceae bacterium]QDP65291.1 MAG: putative glycosyl hydrolase [Prokaryotic dsDNA virus sp.]|tara:strand:+ start:39066 stop:39875 length:810 start_codon:yes stop_codon:yes gene_type:complete